MGGPPLLEREGELEVLDAAIRGAASAQGGTVVFEGPAGIGKTVLVQEATDRAMAAGMTVVAAHAAVLEQAFGFGVVRQLFETPVTHAAPRDRRRLLAGAAGLAAPVVAASEAAEDGTAPSGQDAVIHGLYWLTANLAARAPVLLTVDDLQWADPPSLRFLAYLARRLEGMCVLVVGAVRSGEPQVDGPLVRELVAGPGVRTVAPQPLSPPAVGELVRERLGVAADPAFVAACHDATGGMPFLVRELTAALGVDGLAPTSEAATRVAEMGPATVAHAMALRLARLGPSVAAVARAVAVLDRHAQLDRVTALAEVTEREVRAAQVRLVEMEILATGPTVTFVHPLVRRAVYNDMTAVERADAHARAARLLLGQHAPPEEVAAHLLLCEPAGRPEVVQSLREAASIALVRGAPQSAAIYLRRARDEGRTPPDRATMAHDVARAHALAGDPRAVADYQEAMLLAGDGPARAAMAEELADLHYLSGQWAACVDVLRRAITELGDEDTDLAARLEGARTGTEVYDPRYAADVAARMPRLRALIDQGGAGSRRLALVLAARLVHRGEDSAQVARLVAQGLDGGGLVRDEGAESMAVPQAIVALVASDELDAADELAGVLLVDARRRGSVVGFLLGSWSKLWVAAVRGDLDDSSGHLRASMDVARENGLMQALPTVFFAAIDVLIERPELADAVALVETIDLDPAFASTMAGALLLVARGRLRAGRGERDSAAADLRAAGEIFTALEFRSPFMSAWRSPLALALPAEAAADARALIESELLDARRCRLPRCEAIALRAAGLLAGGPDGVKLLEESLAVLEPIDAPLERARTLVELGGALRRIDQRVAARPPLTAGLELAQRCGATRLADRALEELRIAGARPRRRVVTGPESLTPGEARVARMAADGMTTRDIAQALFVTAKTVENQLGAAYRKLHVTSRRQLAGALDTPTTTTRLRS